MSRGDGGRRFLLFGEEVHKCENAVAAARSTGGPLFAVRAAEAEIVRIGEQLPKKREGRPRRSTGG